MIDLRGITKSFHGVVANNAVDFDIRPGEIHALLGENGAGKSTLMNIMAGVYQPDLGEVRVDGQVVHLATPLDAISAGIGMVHQHFKLVPAFTVAENVHLGWSDTPGWVSQRVLEERTAALAKRYAIDVRPHMKVRDLSAGEQQRAEILRVLARGARVIVMDEPTAVLTPEEAQQLMQSLRKFCDDGKSVVLISHKLGEVLAVADRITVMRAGEVTASDAASAFSIESLAVALVGKASAMPRRVDAPSATASGSVPSIELDGVGVTDDRGWTVLSGIDLQVRPGEILGIAGVAGNGQRELSEVLTGMRAPTAGRVVIDGTAIDEPTPSAFAARGIGHIPDDRLRTALAGTLSVTANAVLRDYGQPAMRHGPWLDRGALGALARTICDLANVKLANLNIPIHDLSGGNQQRVVVRREIRLATRALVAAYPTRGLDVGAVRALQQFLLDLSATGVGVVLISEDLDELLMLADRIAVMFKGRITAVVDADGADREAIGLLMSGHGADEVVLKEKLHA